MAIVFCRNCGHEVKGKFCTNCGTPLEDSDQPAADAGATSVIRSEDLLKKAQEELNASPASQDSTAGQSSDFPQPDATGPAPSQPGWQSPTPQSDPQWQSPTSQSGQGWQNPTPQAGQGWQQPPPQQ